MDTSELVVIFKRAKEFLAAHEQEETEDPSKNELFVRSALKTHTPKSPNYTPTSFDYMPASPIYTPASPNYTLATPRSDNQPSFEMGSSNAFNSALSLQIENLSNQLHSMDQNIANRFHHLEQAWVTTNTNVD